MQTKLQRSDTGLSDQLVDKLGIEIASGKITEGTVLTSTHLEAKYGVSRTVVREALQILHNLGLTLAVPCAVVLLFKPCAGYASFDYEPWLLVRKI